MLVGRERTAVENESQPRPPPATGTGVDNPRDARPDASGPHGCGRMPRVDESRNDAPFETFISAGAAPLESILCTEELRRRPSRPPDYEAENRALSELAIALADSPQTILQTLADILLTILHADSAGLSLLTKDKGRFFWAAIAGEWRPHIGGGTPRDFGPRGDVLDRNVPMLFSHWERRYPYLSAAMPLADEGLLIPFHVAGESVGTLWVIAHSDRRTFDLEDLRLLESMGRFASAAYQTVQLVEHLQLEMAGRSEAQHQARELAETLEAQVRIRTEELRRSEALLAEAQSLSATGSFVWRPATDEITWSEQTYRIYEFDRAQPVTLGRIVSRVHPDDTSLFDETIEWARNGGGDFVYEQRLRMPDLSIKYLHIVAREIRGPDGGLEYIGSIQDVTERRLSEEALGRVRSELARVARITSFGALTASIAHEVNQPLSGVITNASTCLRMLDSTPPDVDGARETARRMIRDGNRASEVIKRLRALFGKRDVATEPVALNEATREVTALVSRELQGHRVILRTELGDDLPPVIGDRVQLQQVILNLLLNAVDAMSGVEDRPRQLEIKTDRNDDHVRLAVRDAGSGLMPEEVEKLFDAFYSTKRGGMGMGLSVSRSIIESHHGRLWAARNVGPGATFSFSIPRWPEGVMGAHRHGAIRRPAATDAADVMGKP